MERAQKELIKEYPHHEEMEAVAELAVAEVPVGVVVEAVAVVEDKNI